MLKQPFGPMARFFTRERFGRPQFLAALLLLIFAAQCAWLIARASGVPDSDLDENRILAGLQLWHGQAASSAYGHGSTDTTRDSSAAGAYRDHSPMYYLIASGPLLIWPGEVSAVSPLWAWLVRAPFVAFGILLGGSLWYVARRLYGNAGGYMALTLYCFSPGMIRSSAIWFAEPETGAAWGAFGAVFTAIAVAHTLYAPREVVLWNWRRIVLLGLSLALAIGSQFSLVVILVIVLLLMLYVAPTRRGAAVVIWLAACLVAAFLLFASYGFHAGTFLGDMHAARWLGWVRQAVVMPIAYRELLSQLGQMCPALVFAMPVALAAYVAWPRTRYFGNTAPLLVAAASLALGLASPHYPGLGFRLIALPFLFLFIAGVAADLLETRHRQLVLACVWGLLGAYAARSLWELIKTLHT